MKKNANLTSFQFVIHQSLIIKLRLTLILCCFGICHAVGFSDSFQGRIELNHDQMPIKEILDDIKTQIRVKFFYCNDQIDLKQKVSIRVEGETLENVLQLLFEDTNISYQIIDRQIILKRKVLKNKLEIQLEIKGNVKDSRGDPLPGANVLVKGTSIGAQTDFEGNFIINLSGDNAILVVSYLGFETKEVDVTGKNFVNIVLKDVSSKLKDVILVGSRNPSRTLTETPVPIDVIDITQVATQGPQTSLNEILNYVAPSFTSQSQTVSDGTDHIDPASLRGLGPDQVLVLINGKRRHNTSLINVNGTVGAGSVGTDLNAIPTAAIQRIEVLRDGAAAQYGSDAIAGVINIVLKKKTGELDITVTTGANFSENSNQFDGRSDGEKVKIEANYGLALGEKGGFINFTGALSTREPALRNRDYQGDIFRGFHGAERIFAAGGGNVAEMTLADYQTAAQGLTYLSQADKDVIAALDLSNPDISPDTADPNVITLRDVLDFDADENELAARGLTRSDFRFRVGTAKLREGKFFANMSIPLSEESEIYGFGGISYREGLASGFYRRPAQGDGRANTPAFPNGFLPDIATDIVDKSIAVGIKGEIKDWNVDFSNTYGINTFGITVENSSNGTLGVATPRTFDAGALKFMQNTTNLDINKFHKDVFSGLNVAMGVEYKVENYGITAGEEASYTSYDINGNPVTSVTPDTDLVRNNFTGVPLAGGAQVFRGYDPDNETDKFRNSFAAYVDVEADFTEQLLVSLAGRYENFSDFGDTFNYKLAARYKITENLSIRGANSTGFRAPSLHQQFFSRTSTVFVDNQPFEQGTFTNDSRAAPLIGIAKLKEETSDSYSIGLTAKIQDFTITADAYLIHIDDRIVYSGSFGNGGDPELTRIFEAAGATSARFFVNAIDTKSQGIDVVVSHKINLGDDTSLKSDLSGTFAKTEVEEIRVPIRIANAGLSGDFFDAQEEAFLTLAQPRTKIGLTNVLSVGKYNILLRNVFFGEVTDPDEFNGNPRVDRTPVSDDAVYGGKIITDLSFSTTIFDHLNVTIGANNLLDVYPDENRAEGTAGDQFVYSRRTSQFGYAGRFLFARINFNL